MANDLKQVVEDYPNDKTTGEETEQTQGKRTSTSKFVRGSAVLFIGQLIAIGLKFIVQILVVRYLPKQEYGAFSYALNMIDIAVILSLLALDKSASRFVPIYDEERDYDSLFGLIIISLVTIIGISVAIVLVFIAGERLLSSTLITDPLAASLLTIVIILAPLQALDNWFQSLFAAFTSVRAIFFRRYILLPVFQLIAIILVFLTHSSVFWLAGGYVIGGIVGTIMYVSLLVSLLRGRGILDKLKWQTAKIKPGEIFKFSLPMFFTGFVLIIRSQLVVIVLEFFKGTIAVAEYRAVLPVVRLNSIIYTSFIFLYLPLAARLYAKDDHEGISDIFWRTAAWIAVANLPVFLVSFSLARPVVSTILGENYASSAIIMAIMSLGAYVDALMGFNKDTLRAYNKVGYLFVVDIVVMFVALVSYFLFIPQYGTVGAAITYTAALILTNLLYHFGLVRHVGMKVFEPKYLPIYLSVAVGAIGLGILQLALNLSIWVGVPIAVLISLGLLRLSASRLQIGEAFPELLNVPILKQLIR